MAASSHLVEKYDESIKAIDLMIAAIPEGLKESDFEIIVSKKIAQDLIDSNVIANQKQLVVKSGLEFKWKGFNCRVV